MQLQWNSRSCTYLQQTLAQVYHQEQTQEVRLPEQMPDISRILCAWGQPVLRSKQWRTDGVLLTGGITAWVLYLPEEGAKPESMEVWIPFQSRCDTAGGDQEGVIRACCCLRELDARMLSARKMMIRTTVSLMCESLQQTTVQVVSPPEDTGAVQLLRRHYPMQLRKEAGEKLFLVQEELPISGPAPKKILACEARCNVTEQSALGGKAVFRGQCRIHLVYLSEDERLISEECELPFAQFTDLDADYDKEATAQVMMALSSLETELLEGHIHIKCGIMAQYVIFDRCLIEVAEDAFSTETVLQTDSETLFLQGVLEHARQPVEVSTNIPIPAVNMVDLTYWPDHPVVYREGDMAVAELPGCMQLIYYDENNVLRAEKYSCCSRTELPADATCRVDVVVWPDQQPVCHMTGEGTRLRCSCTAERITTAEHTIPMLTQLNPGEPILQDPDRPALVLRRPGGESLWELARHYGSSVEAIRAANGLESEPAPDRMILIPIP